jgi:predicted RND superfamily exporter protein
MASLGFGFERLGYVAQKRPRITALAMIIITIFCAFGVARLEASGVLSDFFRAENDDFRAYQAMSERFPTSEFDVFIIIEGDKLLTRERLEDVRTLHLELQFVPAVNGVLSMFSMREQPDAQGYPAPLFPAVLPEGAAFDTLMGRVMANPLLEGKLLSVSDEDAPLTLLIVSLSRDVVSGMGLGGAINEVRQLTQDLIAANGLQVALAGAPVMQYELRESVQNDRLLFNLSGVAVGMLIAFVFFQRFSLIFIATLCPVVAAILALGVLGHLQVNLDSLINTIPPLVMVIAFSDAMHMIFAIRRRIDEGFTRQEAVRYSVKTIGPACALTSITTALAMLCLYYSDSALIRTFGLSAAFATFSAFFVVVLIVPSLSMILIGDEDKFRMSDASRMTMMNRIDRLCLRIAAFVRPNFMILSLVGLVLLGLATALYVQLEPRYRLSDQIPQDREAMAGSQRLDAKLTGAQPIHVMVRWPAEKDLFDDDVLGAIAKADRIMAANARVGNVWSLHTLDGWLRETGEDARRLLKPYVTQLPEHLTKRFINNEEHGALVTGRIANLDAADTVPIVREIEAALDEARAAYPEFSFVVTGLAVVAALQSDNMIRQLSIGLLIAACIVILVIGLAFRSMFMFGISILPNIFPLVGTGAILYLMGGGLEYASVIALTVAFGLAVDDTIHLLNRLRHEESLTNSPEKAISQTIARVGPVLILTTLVLGLGLTVTMFSALPPTQIFGQLVIIMLVVALLSDLFFMPALVLFVRKFTAHGRRVDDDEKVSP